MPSSSVTPPEPPRPPGQPTGRSGPWASDGEFTLLVRVTPVYPYTALVEGLEGYVIVEFTVTRDGTVDEIRIVESTRPEFEQPAIATVAKAKYRPRVVGGIAVDVPGQRARITFRLED